MWRSALRISVELAALRVAAAYGVNEWGRMVLNATLALDPLP
ncbi:MAG: hypothetical protein V3V20_12035 [Algisphaera sp.]